MRKRYNTPHRSRVVKTRMTEEEYAEFAERLSAYNMSQAEFIRQAITGAAIRPIITVSPVNDELLAAVGKLTGEYGRIGGNLNQIARTLNEWHSPYELISMVTEKNNMHDIDTFMFFKWIFKAFVAVYLVTHTFDTAGKESAPKSLRRRSGKRSFVKAVRTIS